jgi:DNA primase
VAGRIRDEDIAEVREKVRIEEVVSDYVTLRPAGGGSLKGLCPFHDEKSPSFNVNPQRHFFHCFGCGEGGDVISFLMKIDGLSFGEVVERLADKAGVTLRREDGGEARSERPRGPQRSRLVEAHRVAQEFYADALGSAEAVAARRFLGERGFDQSAAEQFGVGFAPRDGKALLTHLRHKRFTDEESVAAGLVAIGQSTYDRFRGRLLWPIRDAGGDTIGFGARRIFDDDRIDAKYLNTPETAIYKKSHVLYGLDLARREMARTSKAVVVEGYTDVMACHLAGVGTAVATCGTAFGDDHARILRRFLNDHAEFPGEIIFTGDAAGQKAALRAFGGDQNFVSQTYVAIEPTGLDPCDLRLQEGDAAVRELIARRQPLYRFVLTNVVKKYDLDRAEGRVGAVREAAALVHSSRDSAVVTSSFAREIASLTGMDPADVQVEVRRAAGRRPAVGRDQSRDQGRDQGRDQSTPAQAPRQQVPHLRDPRFVLERETLKLVVQEPAAVARTAGDLGANDFTHPTYRAVWDLVERSGGPGAATADWAGRLRDQAADPAVAAALSALAVEALPSIKGADDAFVSNTVYRLQELTAQRRIAEVKSRLQRTNPVEHTTEYNRMFGELTALEQHRRQLRDLALGAT